MDKTESLLKELSEAGGLPGHEHEIRALLREHLGGLGTISCDKLGSLICRRRGDCESPRVMIAAHMDEVGLMVSQIRRDGAVEFVALGSWLDQVLPAQRFTIRTSQGDVTAVISTLAPQLVPRKERNRVLDRGSMFLDTGAVDDEEVRSLGVRLGDPVIPASRFEVLANGRTYLGKAWDDRASCAAMVQAMEQLAGAGHPNTVYAVGTVQEEVGARGAQTSARIIEPDVAIVLESSIMTDLGTAESDAPQARLGRGPILVLMDPGLIPNLRLRDLVIQVAEEQGIPLQQEVWPGAGDDGATIHLTAAGVPTVVLAVPTRNVHCHAGIIHREDYDNLIRLVVALVRSLGSETVARFTSFAEGPQPQPGLHWRHSARLANVPAAKTRGCSAPGSSRSCVKATRLQGPYEVSGTMVEGTAGSLTVAFLGGDLLPVLPKPMPLGLSEPVNVAGLFRRVEEAIGMPEVRAKTSRYLLGSVDGMGARYLQGWGRPIGSRAVLAAAVPMGGG